MDELARFCCLNTDCPDHGRRRGDNLRVAFRYGPRDSRRMLACKSCGARFSERAGTPLFDCRLPDDKVIDVLKHVAEGCGVRQTARLCGVHRDTVVRLSRLAGEHAAELHQELVAFSPRDP